jgi:hypothetical protein
MMKLPFEFSVAVLQVHIHMYFAVKRLFGSSIEPVR